VTGNRHRRAPIAPHSGIDDCASEVTLTTSASGQIDLITPIMAPTVPSAGPKSVIRVMMGRGAWLWHAIFNWHQPI
jgi:hypothetical protein